MHYFSRINFAEAKIIFNIIDIIEINISINVKKITQCSSAEDRYIKRLHYPSPSVWSACFGTGEFQEVLQSCDFLGSVNLDQPFDRSF